MERGGWRLQQAHRRSLRGVSWVAVLDVITAAFCIYVIVATTTDYISNPFLRKIMSTRKEEEVVECVECLLYYANARCPERICRVQLHFLLLHRHYCSNDKSSEGISICPIIRHQTPFQTPDSDPRSQRPCLTATTQCTQQRIVVNTPSLRIEPRLLLESCLTVTITGSVPLRARWHLRLLL